MKHALPDNAIIIDGEMHELVEADGYELICRECSLYEKCYPLMEIPALICTRVHGADAGQIYKRRYL